MVDLELSGKVALITGASAGIGRETSKVLASEGVQTILVARNIERLTEVADEIVKEGGKPPMTISVDLTSKGASRHVFDKVMEKFHTVDIIVNSAGGSRPLDMFAPDDAWMEAMDTNFNQVRRLTETFLPVMMEKKWGRVINITGSLEPKGINAAGSAKAAVHSWAKGLSIEVARSGVTINSISPGRIMSDQIRRLYPTDDDRQKFVEKYIPVGFFGEPADIAYLIAFLVSPKGRYITGEIIHVDGGIRRFAF